MSDVPVDEQIESIVPLDETDVVDYDDVAALRDVDSWSSVSSKGALTANRKVITSSFKFFETVLNGKVSKCRNSGKVVEIFRFVDGLEENFKLVVIEIQNNKCTIEPPFATIDPIVKNVIMSRMQNIRESVHAESMKLETVIKLEQLNAHVKKNACNFWYLYNHRPSSTKTKIPTI